jgi:hypothetical protein
MEDLIKRGLEIRDRYFDTKYGAECDSGIIYDGGGRGYKVGIRWYFPKSKFILDQIVRFAEDIDQRYQAIREDTCPIACHNIIGLRYTNFIPARYLFLGEI